MNILHFKINGQHLQKVGDFSGIIRGTKNYLKCHFSFEDNDWFGLKKIAVFENQGEPSAVMLERDNTCQVPNEVTDGTYFKVSIVGISGKDKKITTNKELINQGG